jgi:MFS superfamily sulfate permease-like transporter
MNVPQALGYAQIAGTPCSTLYSLLLPLVALEAIEFSRYLLVAAVSATLAILAKSVKNDTHRQRPLSAIQDPLGHTWRISTHKEDFKANGGRNEHDTGQSF